MLWKSENHVERYAPLFLKRVPYSGILPNHDLQDGTRCIMMQLCQSSTTIRMKIIPRTIKSEIYDEQRVIVNISWRA